MSRAKEPFFDCIARTLRAALCILQSPSTFADGESAVPEVELSCSPSPHLSAPSLRGHTLHLYWTQGDACCVETTHNSTRVSFYFAAGHQQDDPLTSQLLQQYVTFFCHHGGATGRLPVLRCAPVARQPTPSFEPVPSPPSSSLASPPQHAEVKDGDSGTYDVTFLVLPQHVEEMGSEAIIAFIIQFVQGVEADVAGLKVSLNERRRAAAHAFFAAC